MEERSASCSQTSTLSCDSILPNLSSQLKIDCKEKKIRLNPMQLKRQRRSGKRQRTTSSTIQSTESLMLTRSVPSSKLNLTEKMRILMDNRMLKSTNHAQLDVEQRKVNERLQEIFMNNVLSVKRGLPHDWSLKKSLTVVSSFHFPAKKLNPFLQDCNFQSILSSPKESQQLSAFQENMDPMERWQQAQHYWIHPSSIFSPNPVIHNSREKSELLCDSCDTSVATVERRRDFQDAVRSLYYMFRHDSGHSDNLTSFCKEFMRTPINSDQMGEPQDSTEQQPLALLSSSTKALRSYLTELGIPFTLPLIPEDKKEQDHTNDVLLKELAELRQKSAIQTKMATSLSTTSISIQDSTLCFQGHHGVHGLYDYLFNYKAPSTQDIPHLYACCPFQNATLKVLRVRDFGRIVFSDGNRAFRMDISGVILPDALHTICESLRTYSMSEFKDGDENAQFKVYLEVDEETIHFNINNESDEVGKALAKDLDRRIFTEIAWNNKSGYNITTSKT